MKCPMCDDTRVIQITTPPYKTRECLTCGHHWVVEMEVPSA